MPRRNFKSRPYQLATEPLSAVTMQWSGKRGESSQKTRWGLIGSASFMARLSSTFHQSVRLSLIVSRHFVSVFCSSSGNRARKVAAVAEEIDLHRIAKTEVLALDVDLHAARASGLRQKLAV
jgi:hypothetical protein